MEQAQKTINVSKIAKEINKGLLLENKNLNDKCQELIKLSKRLDFENKQVRANIFKFKESFTDN
ncbi:hypothetical protein IDE00_002788 [Enterococcus faecalis]|uniref:hypothetical protein n=1 Tax=Enterococcus TaxID=1350 RepID=UPI0008781E0A|nr:hypothetical protein [Enterococcus faecalis]EGO2801443.1 hypothetical protein [Enterococcus faecalis]EGO8395781.1 hypothetical protein [Enterococcus faecalis]EGO8511770.1 hypothetical protein [Enterococcus faecalis]EGO9445304.1 hypothetical protein [Enterococcus faecalis]EKZ0100094.1 hypothetical protein [Enterococcus faecalis]